MILVLTADAGSRGNPGPAALGLAVWEIDSEINHIQELQDIVTKVSPTFCDQKFLGEITNNQAEWQGLIAALNYLINFKDIKKADQIFIALDSLLVIKQITGQYKVKNIGLQPLYLEAKLFLSNLPKINFHHIYREYNFVADKLVNQCLDSCLN